LVRTLILRIEAEIHINIVRLGEALGVEFWTAVEFVGGVRARRGVYTFRRLFDLVFVCLARLAVAAPGRFDDAGDGREIDVAAMEIDRVKA